MRKPKFKIGDIVKYAHGKKEYMIDDVKTYGDNGIEYALLYQNLILEFPEENIGNMKKNWNSLCRSNFKKVAA